MKGIIKFFEEVRSELKKVTWPSKDETVRMTIVVIITTIIVGAYVGVIDYGLTKILGKFIQ